MMNRRDFLAKGSTAAGAGLVLAAPSILKAADGNIVTSPIAMQRELIDFWGPVYAKKPIDLPAANIVLDIYGRRHKELIKAFKSCILLDKSVFCKIIKNI